METTSGMMESAIHVLVMTAAGLPLLLGLFLDINAGVILLMIVAFFAHAATALWDAAYAVERRKVTPSEQHVHSFLEVLPFCAVSCASTCTGTSSHHCLGRATRSPGRRTIQDTRLFCTVLWSLIRLL